MQEDKEPNRQSESEADGRTVRERTVLHMENLMRITTFGAGIALACNAQQAQVRPPQVVDPPPPPPSRCCENPDELLVRGCMNSAAAWENTAGRWSVRLAVYAGRPISFFGLVTEEVKITGATLSPGYKLNPRESVDFVLLPAANEKRVTIEFPVNCDRKRIPIKLRLDLSKPRAEKGTVPVTLVKSTVLRNQDIIRLAKAGVSDASIIQSIRDSSCEFDTTEAAVVELRKGGVSGAVVAAMRSAAK